MKVTLKDVKIYQKGIFKSGDFSFETDSLSIPSAPQGIIVSKLNNCFVFPAFCDVHVHLREPGFSYKEDVLSGTMSAAAGGYSDVFSMPNLNPVPDSEEHINEQISAIKEKAVINVHPYASITIAQKGEELSDFYSLKDLCAGFSDDGRGVQSEELMREAMIKAKELDKIIVAHCEDNSLLNGGYIHDGEYAKLHGHRGICSESEWKPVQRDLKLAKETGAKYHVCHISCKETVELIRKAKAEGVDVTCETAPHYLVMNDMDLKEHGRFKMNPPIRSEEDRLALLEGLKDGTIDMIATDHAPHTSEEKSKGLEKSLMGVVGLETAFAVLYTKLVKTGEITLEKLIEVMSINPRKRFGLSETNDFCVFDLNEEFIVNPEEFKSRGRATPFENEKLSGKCKLTVCGEKTVYQNI
ncbi:MAG: dihydroorotase [Clostridia bacterium]|nr:dihydroorotase [Clostridia bacterium]